MAVAGVLLIIAGIYHGRGTDTQAYASEIEKVDSVGTKRQPAAPAVKSAPSVKGKVSTPARADSVMFEKAVQIIKKYEGLHQPRHWPLVGYGHLIIPGDKFPRHKALSESQAEALLRKDLLKNCAVFRSFGADSLILGTLAYNIGSGNVKRSSVTKALRNGNRDIRNLYLAHCRYKGKALSQLKRRRIEEFETLFITADSVKLAQPQTIVSDAPKTACAKKHVADGNNPQLVSVTLSNYLFAR